MFNPAAGGASSYSFKNADNGYSYGAELEFRKRLDFSEAFKNFTIQANAAFIESKVKAAGLKVDRPLLGQSPYVANIGLLYDAEKAGLNITVLLNKIGPRLAFVGNIDDGVPDIYEAPRTLLDFQIAKKIISNKGEIKLNVSDILNENLYFYQNADGKTGLQKSSDAYRFTRKFGTTFSLTFNYSIL